MKTKNFLLFSTSVFAISIFLIVFHSQPPQSIQSIVSQTHQHIKDFQEKLRDVSEKHLVEEERYLRLLGLAGEGEGEGEGGGVERWHNTTVPALVTYARGDAHAMAVEFVLHAATLPYTLLLYNIGLKPASLAIVSSYCNSSKCAVVDLDLSEFPSHVSDESIHAVRPLIIQHALSRVGGVIFCESWLRWAGGAAGLGGAWARAAAAPGGCGAWPRRAAVTSLTHPRMFHYLHARLEDFLFVQMVEATRLVVAGSPRAPDLMRPWIRCALTLDCIMPLGAQSAGCRFDKKPQYRYSGCHEQDASALSIILGLRSGFEESQYAVRGAPAAGWRRVADAQARLAFAARLRNATAAADVEARPDRTPAPTEPPSPRARPPPPPAPSSRPRG